MSSRVFISKPAGFRPNKRLGQHFLSDAGLIHQMIAQSGFGAADEILEIGPGLGALTKVLAECVKYVFAVEKDPVLAEHLQKYFALSGNGNVTIINRDILRFDFSELPDPASGKVAVIGNLPYNISSPLLEKLIRNQARISRAVLMFQLELAERLTSKPGQRAYNALTVLIQYHARVTPLLKVPKEAFFPKPKVDAMVLEIDFTKPFMEKARDEAFFKKVVKAAFAHKRKTVFNSLRGSLSAFDSREIERALTDCGIETCRRAETLLLHDFVRLSAVLGSSA